MTAIYIVQREDMGNISSLRADLEKYCKEIVENERTLIFVPKDGFVATLGLFFTEKSISYHLEFRKEP